MGENGEIYPKDKARGQSRQRKQADKLCLLC